MFKKAVPIWLENREKEMHLRVQFKSIFEYNGSDDISVRLATSGIYNLYVNGEFVAYGPARAGKGYFRIDEYSITDFLKNGKNVIVIEVCGYYATSFYIQRYESFLSAEVYSKNEVLLWTGAHFTARQNPNYIQKIQRYTYQRPMVESYEFTEKDTYLVDFDLANEKISEVASKNYLERYVGYPNFEKLIAEPFSSGTVKFIKPENFARDRSLTIIGDEITGFTIDELDYIGTDFFQYMSFTPENIVPNGKIKENCYSVYKLPFNSTGMINFGVECFEDMTLYVFFDEIISNGKIDALRLEGANIIKYKLPKGVHNLRMFEVYTMMYIGIMAVGGECSINYVGLTEYKHPEIKYDTSVFSPEIKKIADAAIESYRQNAVDLYTDCPSRERAGWLCDSYFISKTEYCLTGKTVIERNFLENFLCEENYDGIPKDMIPMCYPSDHLTGQFIPQWAMWLVIELEEYLERSNDREMIERYKEKLFRLYNYFVKFENSDGLLENLEGWNFVEWSKANELTDDVNYPTNMLYSATVAALGRMYNREDLIFKAEQIKNTILKQSFNGRFFSDNAVREDGKLKVTGECTEVCQYYAFFFNVANSETHKELWETLKNDFGPDRIEKGQHPEIYPANAFIGNYLRLDVLMKNLEYNKVYENIAGYFGYMAENTGTLWENITDTASCNHGFAAYVIVWLDELKNKI